MGSLLTVILLALSAPAALAKRGNTTLAAASGGTVTAAATGGGSGCALLLANGVFNTFTSSSSSLSSTVSQSSFQNAMCSSLSTIQQLSTSSSNGGSFGISIAGYGFSLGRSRAEAQARLDAYRSNFCSSSSGSTYGSSLSQSALNTLSRWVDPNLLSAYLDCMKLDQQGLSISYSVTRDLRAITVTIGYFLQTGGGVRFNGYSVTGPATCKYLSTMLKPGFVLNSVNGRHSLQCMRNKPGSVTVTVATSAGASDFELPDLVVPTAEARLNARLTATNDALTKEIAALKAQLASLQSSLQAQKDGLTASLRTEMDNLRSSINTDVNNRVGGLEGRLPAIEEKTNRMSYDGGRDILNLNTARVRINTLSAKDYVRGGFCDEGGAFLASLYSCGADITTWAGCQGNGAHAIACVPNWGGGAKK